MWSELFGNSRPSLSRSPRATEFVLYCLASTEILGENLQWLSQEIRRLLRCQSAHRRLHNSLRLFSITPLYHVSLRSILILFHQGLRSSLSRLSPNPYVQTSAPPPLCKRLHPPPPSIVKQFFFSFPSCEYKLLLPTLK